MWQHFASLLWIGEYAPVPVIITGAFFYPEKSFVLKEVRHEDSVVSNAKRLYKEYLKLQFELSSAADIFIGSSYIKIH